LLLALIVAALAAGPAQAQIYVLESTAVPIRVGASYEPDERITVPAGTYVRVVLPSGKTQTIRGPYSGSVADLSRGHSTNEGVLAWIRMLLQTGGSSERTPGTTRSMRVPAPQAAFSWAAVPAMTDSTICVRKGAALHVRRTPSPRADRITVIDGASGQRSDVEFAPGKETAPWPAGVAPRADATYALLAPDNRPRRQVTLRVLDALPGEDDILAELAARGCKYQFDAWVKEKLAAGRRKGS
jgi:hypothetical protein